MRRLLLLVTTLSLLSLAPLSAQQPTWTQFGTACPGSGGFPVLTALNLPRLNTDFTLQVTGLPLAPPPGPGLMAWIWGFNNTQWGGLPLPYDLGNFGFFGCFAYVSVDVIIPAFHSGAGTTAQLTIFLPNDPSIAGTHFFNQAAFLDPFGQIGFGRVVCVSNAGAGTANF